MPKNVKEVIILYIKKIKLNICEKIFIKKLVLLTTSNAIYVQRKYYFPNIFISKYFFKTFNRLKKYICIKINTNTKVGVRGRCGGPFRWTVGGGSY